MTIRRTTTRRSSHLRRAAGFTLTELLIVIGIIVLMVTLAIPAFSIITGGRSIDSAQNQVSAILGRARADAIGLQEERGVFFYQETAGGQATAAIVRARPDASFSTWPVALDLLPDREHLTLPNGVGVHTILNATLSGMTRTSDGYLGHNTLIQTWNSAHPPPPGAGNTAVGFGGVILFDSKGRLESKPYLFIVSEQTPTGNQWTEMGKLLLPPSVTAGTPSGAPQYITTALAPNIPLNSQIGFILFDEPTFVAQNFTDGDPAVDTSPSIGTYTSRLPAGAPTEKQEEDWIDGNGVPFLVNRYNGTLMRGE